MKARFILEIYGGVDLTIHGPFTEETAFIDSAQEVRDDQDPATDSIFAVELDGDRLSLIRCPGVDYEICECGAKVCRSDPYFATPCGTFCSDCMEDKHAQECSVCAGEFDLRAAE